MQLYIISPEKKSLYNVAWVEAFTDEGSFVIQLGHAPMILILKPNEQVRFRLASGQNDAVEVPRGIMEISRTQVTVLVSAL
jgi:F0F1-type ATP synthase epsilon subunit